MWIKSIIRPRWRKVFADLSENKIRTILVILSIAVGVFAVGALSTLYIILSEDMDSDYQSANPHSAIIYCAPFENDLVQTVSRMPGIAAAEGRSGIVARIEAPDGKKYPINILAIPPVEDMQIDHIRPEIKGEQLSLNNKQIFIERTALEYLPLKPGDKVNIVLPDGKVRALEVASIVHDVNSISYMFTGSFTAFVNPDTMEWLGGSKDFNRMYVTVSESKKNESHVNAIAQQVADKIEKGGRKVYSTIVYKPGQHPIQSHFDTALLLFGAFGILMVALSAFLVTNTINSLLSQHIRYIGMMKSIGGKNDQLIGMYIILVLIFGFWALVIAVPTSALFSNSLIGVFARMFNFNPGGYRIPVITLILQVAIAMGAPALAALVPVRNGTKLSIREATTNYGLGKGKYGQSRLDRLMEKIRSLPRPMLLSLRNSMRRKSRLILTLSTLTLGGAVFIAVFNLRASLYDAIEQTLGYSMTDVNITLEKPRRIQQVAPLVMKIPGVTSVEGWGISNAQALSADKSSSKEIKLWAVPSNSRLIRPVMTSGRWLVPGDENAIVVGNHFIRERPDVTVNSIVRLKIDGKESDWHVVGIYQLPGNVFPPYVYTNYEHFSRILDEVNRVSSFRVLVAHSDSDLQDQVAKAVDITFKEAGVQVSEITTGAENRNQKVAQFDILIYVLLVVAVLIALVGGLGLMGMMSMNVLERTREIGVMRAIGASDWTIIRMVIVEGMLIGTVSWILGVIVSLPISAILTAAVGQAFMDAPLKFVFSYMGFLIWLGGALFISAFASFLPARNASRLTIREVLAYE